MIIVEPAARIELATSRLQNERSAELSYTGKHRALVEN
jgi:hypothetical protein